MDKKWVIIFLIYADFTKDGTTPLDKKLERELERVFHDLLNCSIDENVKVFIAFHKIKYFSGNEMSKTNLKDETIISEIYSTKTGNTFKTIDRYDNLSSIGGKLQKKEQIAEILRKIYTSDNKADHVFLTTWDHGSVFGIFANVQNKLEILEPVNIDDNKYPAFSSFLKSADVKLNAALSDGMESETVYKLGSTKFSFTDKTLARLLNPVFRKNIYTNRLKVSTDIMRNTLTLSREVVDINFKDISGFITEENYNIIKEKFFHVEVRTLAADIEEPFDILTNEELAYAIEYGLGQKVDLLLMMNCWMVNVHTVYALREQVSYLVGPQTGIDEPGYDYQRIIQQINSTTTPETLVAACIETCKFPDQQKYDELLLRNIKMWGIISVDLKRFTALIDVIEMVAIIVSKLFMQQQPNFVFRSARRHCVKFDDDRPYFMTDFMHWLESIIYNTDNEFDTVEGTDLFLQINTCYQLVRAYVEGNPPSYMGPFMYLNEARLGKMTYLPPTGLAIYFPERESLMGQKEKWVTELIMNSSFIKEKDYWLKLIRNWDKIQHPVLV